MSNKSILFVDDDEKLLKGIARQQGDDFDITTAVGGAEALELFDDGEEFAVVVSDMRMPEMNGVQLLTKIREISPNTVRMMFTGFAELNTTIQAVNEGHIFRFLAKPCDDQDLASSLNDALKQYALIEAEKELVEGTLHGSVHVLSEVLSLVSPMAFGQSTRVKATVDGILKRHKIEDQWQLEIAAMLSSLGCVTLPADLLQKKLDGHALTPDEEDTFNKHPLLASDLIKHIPRLDKVAEIIRYHLRAPDKKTDDGKKLPVESQILNLALEFDSLESKCESSLHALNKLRDLNEKHDPELVAALEDFIKNDHNFEMVEVRLHEIAEGMVLADDLRDDNGTLLMSKGQKITSSASRLLGNFARNRSVTAPVKVICTQTAEVATT